MRRQSLAGLLLAVLCGCADPNTYGTPRTLTPGGLQFQAAYSAFAAAARGSSDVVPGLPTVGLRVGVADRVDVGVRVVDLTALGGDAKVNLLRGRIDLAVDPMAEAFYGLPFIRTTVPSIGTFEFHVPVLIGVNFDEATTLIVTPGFVASASTAAAAAYVVGPTVAQTAFTTSGMGARLGLGLNIHQSDTFSWQPEVTAWHEFNSTDVWFCVFGIGMNIGDQPDYSDLAPKE